MLVFGAEVKEDPPFHHLTLLLAGGFLVTRRGVQEAGSVG